jgi:hypothetical protein
MPTLIGAPVAAADDDPVVEPVEDALVDPLVVPPVEPAVVLLLVDLLLDEQAPANRAIATAHNPYESFLFGINFLPPRSDYLAASVRWLESSTRWRAMGSRQSGRISPVWRPAVPDHLSPEWRRRKKEANDIHLNAGHAGPNAHATTGRISNDTVSGSAVRS